MRMWKFIYIDVQLEGYDYFRYTKDREQDYCYYNRCIFERYKGLAQKILRLNYSIKLNNKINNPLKGIFNSLILDSNAKEIASSSDSKLCFILEGSAYRHVDAGICNYLRKKYPQCRLVFAFDGKVDIFYREYKSFSIKKVKELFDIVISYNPLDAQKYGLLQSRPKIIKFLVDKSDADISSDAFFVGAAKDRLDSILYVFKTFISAGLKCDFHIIGVPKEYQVYADIIDYNHRISYDEVLKHIKSTKCVVNILEGGNSGITLRDYEAISFGKFIITDNKSISESPLYDSDNIIFSSDLDENIERIKNSSMPRMWKNTQEFSHQKYYQWLGNELDNLEE